MRLPAPEPAGEIKIVTGSVVAPSKQSEKYKRYLGLITTRHLQVASFQERGDKVLQNDNFFKKNNYSKTKGITLKALKQGSMDTKGIESKCPQVLQRTSRRYPSEFFWNHADLGVMCPRSVVPDFKPS